MDDITEDSISNRNLSEEERDEAHESIDKEKSKLKQQIDDLKSIILQMKCSLDLLKFERTKCNFHSNAAASQRMHEIENVDIHLQNHLYRYSGFHCIKFAAEEYVFNFLPSFKYDKRHTFAVQILNKQGEGALGKWVMPKSVDLIELQSRIPLNDLKNVPQFLRTCKHYVHCYFLRDEQYTLLKDILFRIKNSNIQTNLGYTQVILELMGVYDENNNTYMNLNIYLVYRINEIRPYKIVVDSMTMDTLDKRTKKRVEKSLTCFKNFDLHVAFENIFNEKPFTWTREDNENSPLLIDPQSDSDEEGFLASLSVERSLRSKRKKRQRKKDINVSSVSKSHHEESVSVKRKKQVSKGRNEHSIVDQNINAIESPLNLNDTRRRTLRQRRLNFSQTSSNLQYNTNLACPEASTFVYKKLTEQTHKPYTSTPQRADTERSAHFIVSTDDDISDITVNGSNVDCVKVDDTRKRTRLKRNVRRQNNTSVRLLRSHAIKNMKYVKSK